MPPTEYHHHSARQLDRQMQLTEQKVCLAERLEAGDFEAKTGTSRGILHQSRFAKEDCDRSTRGFAIFKQQNSPALHEFQTCKKTKRTCHRLRGRGNSTSPRLCCFDITRLSEKSINIHTLARSSQVPAAWLVSCS